MAFNPVSPINLTSLAVAGVSIGLASLVWWRRLARVSEMRGNVEKIYALSEEILHLETQTEVRERVERELARLLPVENVQFVETRPEQESPGGLLLAMNFRGAISGWLELRGPGLRLHSEEASALGHLANQIAIAEQLSAQRALQQRLFESERQGAVGQLISSIAAELRPPLQRLKQTRDPATMEREAAEGLGVLDRLISFARPAHGQKTLFDLGSMLRELVELRKEAMRLALVRVELALAESPLGTTAARSQLEQAFLNLLVFAEQALASAEQRVVQLSAQADGAWVVVRLKIAAPAGAETESMLAASRGVIEAHQGRWWMTSGQDQTVIEARLPATESGQPVAGPKRPGRVLTLLAVVPETAAMQQVSEALAACGHRVVPASSGNDALLLASRFGFDGILAAEALPDMEWGEFSARASQAGLPPVLLAWEGAPTPGRHPVLRLPASEAELGDKLAVLIATAARDRAS